jgi:outer membrane receptor for ferrienterochelin and colicin
LVNFNANEVSPKSSFPNALGLYEKIYTYSYDRTLQTNHNIEYQINKNQKLQAGLGLNFTNALPTNYSAFPLPFSRGNLREQLDNQYYVGSEEVLGTGERFVLRRDSLKIVNQYNAGAFVQYKLSILDKLFITAGTRFDYVRQDGNKAMPGLSPKIGVVYTPNNFINLKACFGTAFLAPALDYVHADYVYAVAIVDSVRRQARYEIPYAFLNNPDLNTEQMINGELGLSYSRNKLFIAANAYFNNVKRLIAPSRLLGNATIASYPVDFAEQYTNQKGLIAYGSSLEAEYKDKFGKDEAWGIKIHANYAYNNGQIQAQDADTSSKSLKLPYMAPHTVKAGITLSYKKISLNIRGIFRSPSYNGGIADVTTGELVQTANKAYFVLNTYLYYRLEQAKYGNRYTDIFIRFRNLTNQRYYNPSMNFSDVMVLAPQDPIRWSVGVRFYVLK